MKKGEVSIETIIVIVLALLVLVIVAASFAGGMKNLMAKLGLIADTTGATSLDDAVAKCRTLCNTPAFDTTSYIIPNVGPRSCSAIVTTCGLP